MLKSSRKTLQEISDLLISRGLSKEDGVRILLCARLEPNAEALLSFLKANPAATLPEIDLELARILDEYIANDMAD